MKKIAVLIAAFTLFTSAVSAQQDDFFDIQKYMEKKNKENKQQQKLTLIKPSFKNLFINSPSSQFYNKTLLHTLLNGNKVYLLGQDNMPCVVPDMKKFRQMPNICNPDDYLTEIAFKANIPGSIPNAYPPSGWTYIRK